MDFFDALNLVGLGVDALDLVEGATTLGLSILIGWGASKLVAKHYEPVLQEKIERLKALQDKNIELLRLRKLLGTQLPSAVVAGQLQHVDIQHWGF